VTDSTIERTSQAGRSVDLASPKLDILRIMSELYERIYEIIRLVPRGRVATYGQIAAIVGPPCEARTVGYALAALGETIVHPSVPWQRIVNAQGGISTYPTGRQRAALEHEGIEFDNKGIIDLEGFGWYPDDGPPPKRPSRTSQAKQMPLL
jgi:methylated-DNA-protein-cysteine methyltransferase related protein